MGATPGEEIAKLIAAFNAGQDQVEVTGLFKGVYKDLLTSVVAAWRAGQAPHIAQVFEVGTQTMLSSGPVIKPVWQLAQETGLKLDPNAYIPAVRGYYSQADGKLVSMPFNSSTCIVWYNKDVLEKAGLDPDKFPATWPAVVSLARTLRDKGATQFPAITASVVWAHFEQFSAIHNIPYATEANGFKGLDAVLQINSPRASWRHLQRLLDMAKEGTFHYTGRDGSGDGAFLSGQSGMTFSSSALRGDLVRSAKFRWAPAFLPYDPAVIREPINSAIGGASFWVLTAPQRSAAEYRAVAQFLHFLGRADAGLRVEPRHRLRADHACRLRSGEAAGFLRSEPRHRTTDPSAHPRSGHRQLAWLPSRPHAGDPYHHRGGMRAGTGRQAGREAGARHCGRTRQQGAARLPEVGAYLRWSSASGAK